MTADEIRNTVVECDNGAWESAKWLQEIAAQLAELNATLLLIQQGQPYARIAPIGPRS